MFHVDSHFDTNKSPNTEKRSSSQRASTWNVIKQRTYIHTEPFPVTPGNKRKGKKKKKGDGSLQRKKKKKKRQLFDTTAKKKKKKKGRNEKKKAVVTTT